MWKIIKDLIFVLVITVVVMYILHNLEPSVYPQSPSPWGAQDMLGF